MRCYSEQVERLLTQLCFGLFFETEQGSAHLSRRYYSVALVARCLHLTYSPPRWSPEAPALLALGRESSHWSRIVARKARSWYTAVLYHPAQRFQS